MAYDPIMYYENVLEMSDEQADRYLEEMSKISNEERQARKHAIHYFDGKDYGKEVEPENLSEDQLDNRSFMRGYNAARIEKGKEPLPLPEPKKRSK